MEPACSTMPLTIAIVGGGASGSLTAIQLLRTCTTYLDIHLIERSGVYGKGVAYGTSEYTSLLNVPAGKMSAFPDDPKHFLCWLHKINFCDTQEQAATESSFVPRTIYGRYILETLHTAEIGAKPRVKLIRHHDTVLDIDAHSDSALLHLQSGESIRADKVVLAFGNFPPRDLPVVGKAIRSCPRYIANPWSNSAYDAIGEDDTVLIVGSGLTMVDTVLGLQARGHRGQIVAISKHGLLPQTHYLSSKTIPVPTVNELPTTARELVRYMCKHVEVVTQTEQVDWRVVFDSLRAITSAIWGQLSLEEKRRLLRHAQPYWEVHRHRIPPQSAAVIEQLRRTGQLVIQAGYIKQMDRNKQNIRAVIGQQGEDLVIDAQWTINCTGANSDYSTSSDTLIVNLRQRGIIRSDCLKLGLDAACDGAVLDMQGNASSVLYTLGPTLKGSRWETTAIPEIRQQSVRLASSLLHNITVDEIRLSEILKTGNHIASLYDTFR